MPFGLSSSNVCMRPGFMTLMSCDSVYCMCGAAWSSRWLMMQTAVDQWPTCSRACVPARGGYFERTLWPTLFSLYLMNFMFYTRLDAAGDILRAHYKSMKCDVSFAQGSVSTIFRWGGHVSYMRKNSSWLQQCKIDGDFPQLRSQR